MVLCVAGSALVGVLWGGLFEFFCVCVLLRPGGCAVFCMFHDFFVLDCLHVVLLLVYEVICVVVMLPKCVKVRACFCVYLCVFVCLYPRGLHHPSGL